MTEETAGVQGFWEEFDLSELSYPQFLEFFYDRPVVDHEKAYDLFRGGIDCFVASDPGIVVAHLQAMCCGFSELRKIYSTEQLDQGLWAVFGAGISCERYLFDPTVDLELRIGCIESMYLPFRDVVANSAIGKCDSFYWMWWDMILCTFWLVDGADGYSTLSPDRKQILEAMYQTLLKILALNHPACQWSALHGLGHLNHPLGGDTVERYLDIHRNELADEEVLWIERCRDGSNA
jgi:hypothetical protein